MKTRDAAKHFGSKKKLADALGIQPSAVTMWGEVVPISRQYQLQILSGGSDHMAMTEDDYRDQLQQLFPPGPAFDAELQPDVAQLIDGSAPELARVDAAGAQLSLEQNPATVTWLLPDWEAYLGLPDACTVPGSQTLEERRQAVINKLSATGAPQRSYYLSLAEQAGVEAKIAEFRPARVGPAVAGDFLYGDGWPWCWQVQVGERGALQLIKDGKIREAIAKCANEWASFPGNNYDQNPKALGALLAQWQKLGGALA